MLGLIDADISAIAPLGEMLPGIFRKATSPSPTSPQRATERPRVCWGKPRHNFLYTSSELSRLKRWSPPLCGMNEFEKPQLLSGKGELHLAHHRLGAIEHQGFLRIQRDQ